MKISKIDSSANNNMSFKRLPVGNEVQIYQRTIADTLRALDKKTGIILHNSSAPAKAAEDYGIGSLLSTTVEKSLVPFLRTHGFSTIQQEPDCHRTSFMPSPYSPISIAKNIFMIPLEKLATDEYCNLVTMNVINEDYVPMANGDVSYWRVAKTFDSVLDIAYKEFKVKRDYTHNKKIIPLAKEFEAFKLKNADRLEASAIYEILAKRNKTENWRDWPIEEQTLYDNGGNQTLINGLKRLYRTDIDYFMFKQMLASREIAAANKKNKAAGISVIGDSPIAFTPVEEWQNKDLFFEDYALGCPPDYFSQEGQRWGFAVLKPEKIFNPDGTLGKGGELLKKRYEDMFEANPGGARIDHIIGLIDPWVYTKTEPMRPGINSGRLYSSPEHPVLGKYAKTTDEEYAEIIEKIVIPAAEKFGLTKSDIICEDLGTPNAPTVRVMKKLNLPGIAVTEFNYRGKDQAPEKVIMLGSHDNPSFVEFTNKLFENTNSNDFKEKVQKLAEDTVVPNEPVEQWKNEISSNKKKFMSASFTELFTSPAKRVQVFFTDLFGIGRTYNVPGSFGNNWALRLSGDFEKLYEENLRNGTAMNIPEALARAVRQRGEQFSYLHRALLEKLDYFATMLREW